MLSTHRRDALVGVCRMPLIQLLLDRDAAEIVREWKAAIRAGDVPLRTVKKLKDSADAVLAAASWPPLVYYDVPIIGRMPLNLVMRLLLEHLQAERWSTEPDVPKEFRKT